MNQAAIRYSLCAFVSVWLVASTSRAAASVEPQAPSLRQERAPAATLNLRDGDGTCRIAPARLTFEKNSEPGSTLIVLDDRGRRWMISKTRGPEVESPSVLIGESTAKADVAATRLIWALGFPVRPKCFVTEIPIEGLRGISRVRAVSLTPRQGDLVAMRWSWERNPFLSSHDFRELKVALAVLALRAFDDDLTEIVDVANEGASYELASLDTTLGGPASWGRWKSGDPASYAKAPLVKRVEGSRVVFQRYGRPLNDITSNDVERIVVSVSQFTDTQLLDAFSAGGFSQVESDAYVRVIRTRIANLRR